MDWLKRNRLVLFISIAILLVIFVAPHVAVMNLNEAFNLTTTGQIGDTIGGITAPFINGLAAILVFIAFQEQKRANDILQNMERARNYNEDLKTIKADLVLLDKSIRELCYLYNGNKAYNYAGLYIEANKIKAPILDLMNLLIRIKSDKYSEEDHFLLLRIDSYFYGHIKPQLDLLNAAAGYFKKNPQSLSEEEKKGVRQAEILENYSNNIEQFLDNELNTESTQVRSII